MQVQPLIPHALKMVLTWRTKFQMETPCIKRAGRALSRVLRKHEEVRIKIPSPSSWSR